MAAVACCIDLVCKIINKKAVLSQGNRATGVLLEFADNIRCKFKSSQASKARLHNSKHTGEKQNLRIPLPTSPVTRMQTDSTVNK